MKNPFFFIALFILIVACNQNSQKSKNEIAVSKSSEDDPFAKSMVESQYFDVLAETDTILEGKNGTVIQIPQGAFKDENGNVVTGDVQIELAEPESLDELLLSGISSKSGGKLLESKGVFYLNASQNGEQLFINENNPIYIEKAIEKGNRGDVVIFQGRKEKDGQINWVESKAAEKYLIPVDMNMLDYLPKGFQEEVEAGMPFRSYDKATDELVDSLYYSLFHSVPMIQEEVPSDSASASLLDQIEEDRYGDESDTLAAQCGIDPATIKAIRSKKFEGTLIATREFEKRLKAIYKSCNNELLQLYIDNADKNLWEIDALAAKKLGTSHEMYEVFTDFSKEKLTKVKHSKSAKKIASFYQRKLNSIKKDLQNLKREAFEERKKNNELAIQKQEEYLELLRKREKYRMDKFGFELTQLGWHNGAVYVEELEKFILEVKVIKGDQFDRVHTYIVNNKINSLFSMTSVDQVVFNRGYNEDKYLLMWKEQMADAIVIAYKGEKVFFEKQEFRVSTQVPVLLTFYPTELSERELRKKLRGDFWKRRENKIKVDLAYQAAFEKERKRQVRLRNERIFMNKLRKKAFACCEEDLNGEYFFNHYCSSCHSPYENYLVAPGLKGATSRHSMDWLIRFTQNSQKMIQDGDKEAIRVVEENNKLLMPAQPLSDKKIETIFNYIDSLNQ